MKEGLVILTCLLLLQTAAADTKTRITILNSNPEIKAIYVTDSVQLRLGEEINIWCNTTVNDKNGVLDLNATKIVLYNKENSNESGAASVLYHYSPKVKYIDMIEKTTANISALFTLVDKAAAGEWACAVTTIDNGGASDHASASFHVFAKTCVNGVLDEGEDYQDCNGEYCAPCLELRLNEIEVQAGKETQVPVEFISRSTEKLYIGEISGTGENGDIDVKVDYPTEGVPAKEIVESSARVTVSRKIEPGLHVKTILVKTASGVVSQTAMVVRVLPPPPPELSINFQSSCVKTQNIIRVIDKDTGESVGDSRVEIAQNGRTVFASLTDSFGEVSFKPNETGIYIVNASGGGYPPANKILSVTACGENPKNLVMIMREEGDVGENLVIVVRDQDGAPVKADIGVVEPDGVEYSFSTDVNGKATLQLSKEGRYLIRAEKDKYNSTEKVVTATGLISSNRYLIYAVILLGAFAVVVYRIYKSRQLG